MKGLKNYFNTSKVVEHIYNMANENIRELVNNELQTHIKYRTLSEELKLELVNEIAEQLETDILQDYPREDEITNMDNTILQIIYNK